MGFADTGLLQHCVASGPMAGREIAEACAIMGLMRGQDWVLTRARSRYIVMSRRTVLVREETARALGDRGLRVPVFDLRRKQW